MAREIPQSEWHDFLTDFTRDNEGRKAVLEVGDQHIGDGEGDDVFVLTGVEAGVQAEDEDTIVVELADMEGADQGHVTHRIEDVNALSVRQHEDAVDGLEMDTKGGLHAVLRLEEAVPVTTGT